MRRLLLVLPLLALALPACADREPPAKPGATSANAAASTPSNTDMKILTDFAAVPFKGAEPRSLAAYKGDVVLIVNTAANCGYTPQMGPLGELDRKYQDKHFRVVGFLSDDFGKQGGTTEEVTSCSVKYKATFDEYAHIHVKKGPEQHPLFAWLTSRPGMTADVSWNFNKWLVGRDGHLVARFSSDVEPGSPEMTQAIEAALAK
ncbi:MAG: glutathione peroxidase [Byssovorax sp.]